MKVAQFTLPLTAILVLGTSGFALAGPQSMLDPYVNIKAPSAVKPAKQPKTKSVPAQDASASVTVAPVVSKPSKTHKAPKEPKVAATTTPNTELGVRAGTREMFHGMATATRGAAADIVRPTMKIGSGLANGTKRVGHGLAEGAKNSGQLVAKETGAAGHALAVVPKKMGEGLKTTGSKVKDGTEVAGKGLAGAASKTGEVTKKVAVAPFSMMGRLNPFRHKEAPPAPQTASTPLPAQDKTQ